MHSGFIKFMCVTFSVLFEINAGWQTDDARYLTANKKKYEFGLGKAFDNLETHQHFEKRGAGDISRHLTQETDNKRDLSQLQLICSFIPESYISMENVSGKLTPEKKIRHVPVCCPGYQRAGSGNKEDDYKCVPACESCTYGECVSPNRCKCDDGYENPSGNISTCVPKCFPPCKNSHCASPDRCVCEKGFEHDDFFPNQCIKKRRNERMSEVQGIGEPGRKNVAGSRKTFTLRHKRSSKLEHRKERNYHPQLDPCFAPGTINCPITVTPNIDRNASNRHVRLSKQNGITHQRNKKRNSRNIESKRNDKHKRANKTYKKE